MKKKLDQFVNQCDIIFHLAGVNRHENSKLLFQTNIQLAEKLSNSIKNQKVSRVLSALLHLLKKMKILIMENQNI